MPDPNTKQRELLTWIRLFPLVGRPYRRPVHRSDWPIGSLLLALSASAQFALDPAALDQLFAEADAQHSNALLVYQYEQPVRTKFFDSKDKRVYLYSITKVFTSLAVGLAYDRGAIGSLDAPVSTWFPELAGDPLRSRIKLRHLLQHTSGIFTTQGSRDIYPQRDFVKFALESPIVSTPGEEFKYNNRAVNVASGIVRKATGKSMEVLLASELLRPMGITDYRFRHDRTGNTWAMDGMELNASDLVKLGCLLADGGRWRGQQLISEKWLAVATQASLVSILDRASGYGLGLVIAEPDTRLTIPTSTVDALERLGLTNSLVARLRSLAGQEFKGSKKLGEALKQSFGAADLEAISAVAAREMIPIYRDLSNRALLAHSGEIGEILIALPGYGIAVARTIDEKRGRSGDFGFSSIYRRVLDLVPHETQ